MVLLCLSLRLCWVVLTRNVDASAQKDAATLGTFCFRSKIRKTALQDKVCKMAKDWLVNRNAKSEDEALSGFQQIHLWKIRVSPAAWTSYWVHGQRPETQRRVEDSDWFRKIFANGWKFQIRVCSPSFQFGAPSVACIYVIVSVYVCAHILCMYVGMYACMHVCMHECMYVHIYIYKCVCMCMCMYMYICICICKYVNM